MNLDEQLLRTTVRIESKGTVMRGGAAVPCTVTGTGMFFSAERDGGVIPMLVTNRHVMEGTPEDPVDVSGTHIIIALADESGEPTGEKFPAFIGRAGDNWTPHPDAAVDLCAFPASVIFEAVGAIGKAPCVKVFSSSDIPTPAQELDISAVSDILMIGYPDGRWDSENNLPIVRRGITATPYRVDYMGAPEFLIDCACYQGSSGSPVLLRESGLLRTGNGFQLGGERMHLLGVLYAGPQFAVDGRITFGTAVPRVESQIPMNLGTVIKASRLEELANELVRVHPNAFVPIPNGGELS